PGKNLNATAFTVAYESQIARAFLDQVPAEYPVVERDQLVKLIRRSAYSNVLQTSACHCLPPIQVLNSLNCPPRAGPIIVCRKSRAAVARSCNHPTECRGGPQVNSAGGSSHPRRLAGPTGIQHGQVVKAQPTYAHDL